MSVTDDLEVAQYNYKIRREHEYLTKENEKMFLMLCSFSRDMQSNTSLDKAEVSLEDLENFINQKLERDLNQRKTKTTCVGFE